MCKLTFERTYHLCNCVPQIWEVGKAWSGRCISPQSGLPHFGLNIGDQLYKSWIMGYDVCFPVHTEDRLHEKNSIWAGYQANWPQTV